MSPSEMITLASESCCTALVEADCLPVLLELIEQTNRSQAALILVAGIIRILANIAKVRHRIYMYLFIMHMNVYTISPQWTSTHSSLLQCPNSMEGLTDLVYKVHSSQPALVLATLQLMVTCTSGSKVGISTRSYHILCETFIENCNHPSPCCLITGTQ